MENRIVVTEADFSAAATYRNFLPGDVIAWHRLSPDEQLRQAEAIAQNRITAYEQGRADERAAIVAWMRDFAGCLIRDQENALLGAASAIERGDHRRNG